MFCNNCGYSVDDGSKFCPKCGNNMDLLQNNTNPNTPSGNELNSNYPSGNELSSNYPSDNILKSDYTPDNVQSTNYPADAVPCSDTETTYESGAIATEEIPGVYDETEMPSEETIPEEPPKKKHKALKILLPIVAVLVLLITTALVFGRTIFFAVAPEAYVANLIENTSKELTLELDRVEENVFGFDIKADEALTAAVKFDIKSAYDENKGDFSIANNPADNKIVAYGNIENEYNKISAYAFLDDENIGVMFPGTDGKYLTVPSADFGQKFKTSNGYFSSSVKENDKQSYDLLSALDLSYSSLMQTFATDKETTKELNKITASNLIKLLKESEIGNREKIDYAFDDKSVSAHEITIVVSEKALKNYTKNLYNDLGKNDKIKSSIDYKQMLKFIENMEDGDSDTSYKLDSDYTIKLIEYKDKIVSVSIACTIEETYRDSYYYSHRYDSDSYYNDNYSYTETRDIVITIKTTDRKVLLNGLVIEATTESDRQYTDEDAYTNFKGEETATITLVSDWATKRKKNADDVINITLTASSESETNYDGEDSYRSSDEETLEFVMDFDNEEWELDIDSKYTYDYGDGDKDTTKDSMSYEGKCSKKDGFSFTVDNEWDDVGYESEYDPYAYESWLNEEYSYYRDDYLEYVYYSYYSSSYSSYYSWYNTSSRYTWDVADHDFEEWLCDYYSYDSVSEMSEYHSYTETEVPVECHAKVEFTLKNGVDVKTKDGKNQNILSWKYSDFERIAEKFEEATVK